VDKEEVRDKLPTFKGSSNKSKIKRTLLPNLNQLVKVEEEEEKSKRMDRLVDQEK